MILIKTKAGKMEDVCSKVKDIEKVKEAEMLTGPYDIKVEIEGEDMSEIVNVTVSQIRKLDGIVDTTTCIYIDSGLSEEMSEVLKDAKEEF